MGYTFKTFVAAAAAAVCLAGGASAATIEIKPASTDGVLAGSFTLADGVSTSTGYVAGGFLFDPVNITSGSGSGNCQLFGGNCLQFNQNQVTVMTTNNPTGDAFNLIALSFILDGQPSQISVFDISTDASGALIVKADVSGHQNPDCSGANVFCVQGQTWQNIYFNGLADGVTAIKFDNTGTGNMRIGAIEAVKLTTPVPEVSAVPLPAAGWLLIGGLGALAAVRRRRKAA